MSEHRNEYGQPVGRPVPGWTPRPPFEPVPLAGRTCRIEPLERRHYAGLHRALDVDSPPTVWSYYPAGPYDEAGMNTRLDGLFDIPHVDAFLYCQQARNHRRPLDP